MLAEPATWQTREGDKLASPLPVSVSGGSSCHLAQRYLMLSVARKSYRLGKSAARAIPSF